MGSYLVIFHLYKKVLSNSYLTDSTHATIKIDSIDELDQKIKQTSNKIMENLSGAFPKHTGLKKIISKSVEELEQSHFLAIHSVLKI